MVEVISEVKIKKRRREGRIDRLIKSVAQGKKSERGRESIQILIPAITKKERRERRRERKVGSIKCRPQRN